MKKSRFIVLFFIAILLAGCASAKYTRQDVMPTEAPAEAALFPEPMAAEGSFDNKVSGNYDMAMPAATERMIVRTAHMRVSVANPSESVDAVSKLAQGLGGYVVSSEVSEVVRTESLRYQYSNITIRVPSEKLDEAMRRIREMAADPKTGVINESVSGEDVTAEYVDSEARLKNLEAAEAQLAELLDNAPDLEYTMDVFRELTNIREQIEVTKGRMKYLKESAALSAVSVEFVAEASLKPIEIGGWKPEGTAREALQALINTAQKVVDGLIWFGIYCLPFLIPVGLVLYLIIRAVARRRKQKRAEAFMEAAPSAPAMPPDEQKP